MQERKASIDFEKAELSICQQPPIPLEKPPAMGMACNIEDKNGYTTSQEQLQDPIIGPVLRAKLQDKKPTENQIKALSRPTRRLFQIWEQLSVQNGQLYRQYLKDTSPRLIPQLVLPVNKRDKILKEAHAGAQRRHLGEEKTFSRVRDRFYWPGYHKDVCKWCQACPDCAAKSHSNRAPLQDEKPIPRTIWSGYTPKKFLSVSAENSTDHGRNRTESSNNYRTQFIDCRTHVYLGLNHVLQPFVLSTSVKADRATVDHSILPKAHRALPALTCSCLRTTMMLLSR